MKSAPRDKTRLFRINLLIAVSIVFLLLGIVSIAVKPEATAYLGWIFSACCFAAAFLMIKRNILKKLRR